jgi:XTP/dITP diphosphohydrolase
VSGAFTFRSGDQLIIATHNAGKLAEFGDLFEPLGLNLVSAGELALPEPDETGTTFAENARIKAHAAANAAGKMAMSDDSGLCVDALNGDPGVYTANWAGPQRDFVMAMRRVENALQSAGAANPDARKASFHATLCLALPDGSDRIFTGRVNGTLVWPPRGDLGFGFDPVFMPDGFDITFGEMSSAEKHSWSWTHTGRSHRARAFVAMIEACHEQ